MNRSSEKRRKVTGKSKLTKLIFVVISIIENIFIFASDSSLFIFQIVTGLCVLEYVTHNEIT